MKILILGDGVIGSMYGYELAHSGCDVTHYIRPERADIVRKNGIAISCLDCRGIQKKKQLVYKLKVISSLSKDDTYDLFIISGKSNQLEKTMSDFTEKLSSETTILIFQTLWQDATEIEKYYPHNKILYGFPHIMGGGKNENGIYCTIFGNKNAPSMIGEKNGNITQELKCVEKIFSDANMNPVISDNILGWIYTHFAEAAGLLAGVMQTDDYLNFAQDKAVVKQTIYAIREGLNICRKRGIAVNKIKPQCYYFLPMFIMVPFMKKMYSTDSAKLMIKGHITHSLDEMKSMIYEMIRSGKYYNLKTPYLMKMKDKADTFYA